MCGGYLYIWCMRDELGEFHLIANLSQILKVWACIKLPLVSSARVHNNCKLPVGIIIFVNAWFG